MMPRLFALWLKESIALLRDKHGLIALFIMPTLFILVMTMALRDAFSPGITVDVGYVIVDLDHSDHSQALSKRLAKGATFKLQAADAQSPEAARDGIQTGQYALALVLPKGFGSRLLAPAGADGQATEPLTLLVDPTLNPALQLAFRNQVMAALGALRADELTRRAGKLFGLPTAPGAAERDWPDEITSVAVRNDQSIKPPSSVQQNVPAWLIFAMFFVVIPISSIFIIERQQGTLQRLRTMGVPFRLLLAGKLLPFFVVNQLQALLMVLVGLFVVPMFGSEALEMPSGPGLLNWWAVSVAVSLAAVAWALLVASLARTSEQATIVGGVSNILMGAIGGVMVPKFVMPAFMQKLAALSPMAWGLDGFHTVMLRHGSFADLLPSLLPLLAFAALSLTLAAWLNHRSLAAQS
jgi:ABC-2 type transport system permease protein